MSKILLWAKSSAFVSLPLQPTASGARQGSTKHVHSDAVDLLNRDANQCHGGVTVDRARLIWDGRDGVLREVCNALRTPQLSTSNFACRNVVIIGDYKRSSNPLDKICDQIHGSSSGRFSRSSRAYLPVIEGVGYCEFRRDNKCGAPYSAPIQWRNSMIRRDPNSRNCLMLLAARA